MHRLAPGVAGLLAVAGLSAVATVLVGRELGQGHESRPTADTVPAITAAGTLQPESVLFGDTVTARLTISLDRDRVDPDSVRVAAAFTPWAPVGEARHHRQDGNATTTLVTTYELRCLVASCASERDVQSTDLPPALVTYTTVTRGTSRTRASMAVKWPTLVVSSRISASGAPTAYRADAVTLPTVSYRLDPDLAALILVCGGTLLGLAGCMLVYVALPRRRIEPTRPLALHDPGPTLLERALALLESSARSNGAGDQRRALEFVASELSASGDRQLVRTARLLAWSESVPSVAATTAIAARVRLVLGAAG